MVRTITFIADYEYEAQNEGEVSFAVGDILKIYQSEGDWWYGELTRTGEVGWVPPTYGHVRAEVSPYAERDSKINLAERKQIFDGLIFKQTEFINGLRAFIENVVSPLSLRDNAFKREFMGDSAVAVSFSLLQEMLNACANFDLSLRRSKTNIEIANSVTNFAPSLQIFAQYTSENTKLLCAVAQSTRMLKNYVPTGEHIESTLLSPLQFFDTYKRDFQEFVWLTPDTNPTETEALASALDLVISQTDYVDAKLKEEAKSLQLLNLQTKFTGNPIIYTPGRTLIQEGEMERIKIVDNEVVGKQYYVFLFNDAFIYCQRNILGRYKLAKAFDLKETRLELTDMGGDTEKMHTFQLINKENADKPDVFRVTTSDDDAAEWIRLIKMQLTSTKTRKMDKRGSVIARTTVNIPGVDVSSLGARCASLYRFLTAELMFSEAMSTMNITLIQPMMDASKGAALSANKVTSSVISGGDGGYALKEGQSKHKDALFNSKEAAMSQRQAKEITEALQDADVQIFLRAAEGLSNAVREFVEALEALCNKHGWKDEIAIGSFFNSTSALAMYNQFKSYANGQQAALRILKTPPFQQFYKDAEQYLAVLPGTLEAKIELPRNRVKRILQFMEELDAVTAVDHRDKANVQAAVEALDYMEKDIEEVIRQKKNFETLLSIQKSLMSMSLMGTDPAVAKLASMDRTFIRVGDLKKVCRKSNKTFRFWLFNDMLIYGTSMGMGKYSFNRALDISKCTISVHQSAAHKYAFQIFGSEKSFIVIAPSAGNLQEWVDSINEAKAALVAANPHLAQDDSNESAPIWAADKDSDSCSICRTNFTWINRRHHCRKCGSVVCGKHSKNSVILAHLHKSQKQRVCDECFSNPNRVVSMSHETARAAGLPESVVTSTPMPSPAQTTAPATSPVTATVKTDEAAVAPAPTPVPAAVPAAVTAESVSEPKKLDVSKAWAPTSSKAPATEVDLPPAKKLDIKSKWDPSASASAAAEPPAVPLAVPPAVPPAVLKESPPPVPTTAAPPVPTSPAPPVPEMAPPPLPTASATPPPVPKAATPAATNPPSSGRRRAAPPPPAANGAAVAAPPPVPVAPVVPAAPAATSAKTSPPPPSSRRAAAAAPPPPPPPATTGTAKPPAPASVGGAPPPPPPPDAGARPPPPGSSPAPPPAAPAAAADDGLQKYRKMREMLPEGAVRQKMMTEGFSPAEINSFFGDDSGGGASSPPPPPSSSRSAGAPPPPPPGPPAGGSSSTADPNDPMFKFRKMKEMLPEGAVRQKMTAEGFSPSAIDDFFAGREVKLAAAVPVAVAPSGGGGAGGGGFLAALAAPPKLRAAPSAAEMAANKPVKKPSLLDEISQGKQLKSVVRDDARMKQPAAVTGAGGLLGMLADQMSKRRFNMKVEDSESDSDDGFSDSDDD